MTPRRILPLLILLALLVAPFGRAASAETMMPAAPIAMAGHCEDMAPAAGPHAPDTDKAAIDCMIACAAIATAEAPQVHSVAIVRVAPASLSLPSLVGVRPGADPPPPRGA